MKNRWRFYAWFTCLGLFLPNTMHAATGQAASLAIAKTASLSTAMVGDVFTYNLTVTNAGATTVTTAIVRDSLPAGVQYESYSGPGTYTNGLWTFVPGSPGTISTLTITVMATNTGTVINTALIQSSNPTDTNFANISATATVTVVASIPPIVLTCSSNLTVTANASGVAMVYFNTSVSGGCGSQLNLQSSPPSGSTFSMGTTTVYTSANDSCGDQTNCSFTVTVNPQAGSPIVLTCSSNLTVIASTPNGTNVYFTTSAYGGCSSPLNLSSSPPSGSTFPIGQTTVTTTASDNCGDITNCTFTVTVNPKTYAPIVLSCSSNLTITASTPNGTNVYFTTSAYGGCSSPLNLSSSPPSGSTFPIGQTTVTTTASDNCGNSTNCTFTVTVNPKTYPAIVLTCSSNLTITASTPNGTNVYFTTSAYGGCSSPLNLSSSPPSGSTFPIGQTTVTTTASDNCGNSTNCTFTVTVNPKTYPAIVLTCSSNLTITASTPNGTNVYFTTSAYGGCSSPLNLSSSPPSGSTFPIGQTIVTTTASDNCGDSTNCTFTVTVNPETYPPIVLTCSSNLTVTASTPNGTNVYFTTSAYGGCSSPLNLSSSPPSGSTFPIGQTTVTTTASDNCGDVTNCTFTITVNPKTYPPIVLTCSSNLTITASTPNGTNVYFTTSAYGGCSSPLNLSSSPPSGSAFPIGQTMVTTMASDNCGDFTNCSFAITVTLQNPPALSINVTGNRLLISWPASLAGYGLESSPNLFPRAWSAVTNPPMFNANGQTVLLPLTSTQQFFQLQPP